MIEHIVYILCMVFVGWHLRNFVLYYKFKMLVYKMDADLKKELAENVVNVDISRHNDVLYLHDQQTGEFLVQGKTAEELRDALGKRYPNKTFVATGSMLKQNGLDI